MLWQNHILSKLCSAGSRSQYWTRFYKYTLYIYRKLDSIVEKEKEKDKLKREKINSDDRNDYDSCCRDNTTYKFLVDFIFTTRIDRRQSCVLLKNWNAFFEKYNQLNGITCMKNIRSKYAFWICLVINQLTRIHCGVMLKDLSSVPLGVQCAMCRKINCFYQYEPRFGSKWFSASLGGFSGHLIYSIIVCIK